VTGEKHLKLTVHGSYVGTPELVETWAFNIRQALVFGDVDPVGTFPSNWSPVASFSAHTETDWTTETTWTVDGPGSETFDPESYLTDHVMPALQAFAVASNFSNRVTFLGANLYPCGTLGTAIDGNFARGIFTTIPNGSNSSLQLPAENTLVASWETDKLGRRGRGRIYPPVMGANILDSNGLVDTSPVAAHRDACKALIEALSYTGPLTPNAHVRSVVTGPATSGGSGAWASYAVINGVRVGKVMDTQRRRRRQLSEGYVSTPIDQT
jgi:hypothetical protein